MLDLAGTDPRTVLEARRETLGYVSQFLRVVPRVPTLDIVAEAAVSCGTSPEAARAAAAAMLSRLNLPARLHALPPATFSGGEQQRVNLARGFLGGHPILLLDEPTAALGPGQPRRRDRAGAGGEGARRCHHRHLPRYRHARCRGGPAIPDAADAGSRVTDETILTNARLVLPDRVMMGSIVLRDGLIAELSDVRSHSRGAIDLAEDFLIPGIVDLHTDNLERQVQPRANARWPSRSAMLSHDAQCAVAGVTTVLDALCLGDLGYEADRLRTFQDGVADLDALADPGMFRSEHFLHLRCEVPARDVLDLVEPVIDHRRVRMVSLMDHSPGVGQYSDLSRYRRMRRKEGMDDAEIDNWIVVLQERRARLHAPNRRALLTLVERRGVPVASHDDRTAAEIDVNAADGIRIAEFPVTMEAAQAARARGMDVIAGAPNIVRGGSHSGNVAAADVVRAGAVDALASDYVPASLVEAAFQCADELGIALPAAVALVTDRPARMARLADRGRLEQGLRADLARVHVHDGLPVVRTVWRAGDRVA